MIRAVFNVALIVLALLVVSEGWAEGIKKFGGSSSRIPIHQEWIIDDGAITQPQGTSFCTRAIQEDLHTDNGVGGNVKIRCFAPAGKILTFDIFAITATKAIGAGRNCKMLVARNGVTRASTKITMGGGSAATTNCEASIDADTDGRIEADGDSCMQSLRSAGRGVSIGAGNYVNITFAASIGVCGGADTVHILLDGWLS